MFNIRFTPSVKQFQAYNHLLDAETEFVGYGGAAFSGKSYLLCYWLTICCVAYPDTGWGLGRKELVTLKKTTLITLFKVFDECGIKPADHFNYDQQLNVITFYNKSQIFLIDTAYKPSDPLYTRLGGYELTGAAIDESAETSIIAIDILSTRIGRRNNEKYGLKAKMLETFNPAKNHVYSRYYKPFKDNNQRAGFIFVPALPKDNPSPEVGPYVDRLLKTASQVTIERLIKGNFEYDDDPSTLMGFDAISDLFTNKFVTAGDRYISVDVARKGADQTVIMVWFGWRVEKIVVLKGQATNITVLKVKELQSSYNVPASQTVVDEDGVGGGVVDNLPGCKGFVNNSRPLPNPDEQDYSKKDQPENYDNLKSQCYFRLAKRINNRQIYVNCDMEVQNLLSEELGVIKQKDIDKDGKLRVIPKDEQKELLGRSPDFADALMMREYFTLKKQHTAWAI